MTNWQKFFGFRGRIRRQDWWIGGILVGIAQLVVTFAVASVASAANLTTSSTPLGPFEALAAMPIYMTLPIDLAFLWPTIALSVQRYHDRGGSAWPVFAYFAVIYGAGYIPESATAWTSMLDPAVQQILPFAVLAVGVVLWLWFFIVMGFLDGTQGPNRFGPSPKGIMGAPVAAFE